MEVNIKGHSGCSVNIVEDNNALFIDKYTYDTNYINRLSLQCLKQMTAYKTNNIPNIIIPNIINFSKTDNSFVMRMEYIYSKNYIDYFEYSSVSDIDKFINTIISYINNEITNSKIKTIPVNVFFDKLESIHKACIRNDYTNNNKVISILNDTKNIFKKIESIDIPIGICHGDLTFSNMLFTNSGVCIIDFLDSFIESPLQDIVKIKQDTVYKWSTLLYSKRYDTIRLDIISNYIDDALTKEYSKYDWYNKYYDILQLMNLLRILPYTTNEETVTYLINNISNIIYNYGKI